MTEEHTTEPYKVYGISIEKVNPGVSVRIHTSEGEVVEVARFRMVNELDFIDVPTMRKAVLDYRQGNVTDWLQAEADKREHTYGTEDEAAAGYRRALDLIHSLRKDYDKVRAALVFSEQALDQARAMSPLMVRHDATRLPPQAPVAIVTHDDGEGWQGDAEQVAQAEKVLRSHWPKSVLRSHWPECPGNCTNVCGCWCHNIENVPERGDSAMIRKVKGV